MTIPRVPESIAEAIDEIGKVCTFEACAKAIGRKPDTVRKMSQGKAVPNWKQIIKLERLYRAKGHEPIISNLLKRRTAEEDIEGGCLFQGTVKVQSAAAAASESLARAVHPDSPAGEAITPYEEANIRRDVQTLKNAGHHLSLSIRQHNMLRQA